MPEELEKVTVTIRVNPETAREIHMRGSRITGVLFGDEPVDTREDAERLRDECNHLAVHVGLNFPEEAKANSFDLFATLRALLAKLVCSREVFVLMDDGDATMHSSAAPIGLAVTSETEAKKFLESGRFAAAYQSLRVFNTLEEALEFEADELEKQFPGYKERRKEASDA
jgi:hypothetical protein